MKTVVNYSIRISLDLDEDERFDVPGLAGVSHVDVEGTFMDTDVSLTNGQESLNVGNTHGLPDSLQEHVINVFNKTALFIDDRQKLPEDVIIKEADED